MSCPGLHCPGCSEGQLLAIVGGVVAGLVVAYEAVRRVAERIWWIGFTARASSWSPPLRAGGSNGWPIAAMPDSLPGHGILSRADRILHAPSW
jgi:hypothetical protein